MPEGWEIDGGASGTKLIGYTGQAARQVELAKEKFGHLISADKPFTDEQCVDKAKEIMDKYLYGLSARINKYAAGAWHQEPVPGSAAQTAQQLQLQGFHKKPAAR